MIAQAEQAVREANKLVRQGNRVAQKIRRDKARTSQSVFEEAGGNRPKRKKEPPRKYDGVSASCFHAAFGTTIELKQQNKTGSGSESESESEEEEEPTPRVLPKRKRAAPSTYTEDNWDGFCSHGTQAEAREEALISQGKKQKPAAPLEKPLLEKKCGTCQCPRSKYKCKGARNGNARRGAVCNKESWLREEREQEAQRLKADKAAAIAARTKAREATRAAIHIHLPQPRGCHVRVHAGV